MASLWPVRGRSTAGKGSPRLFGFRMNLYYYLLWSFVIGVVVLNIQRLILFMLRNVL